MAHRPDRVRAGQPRPGDPARGGRRARRRHRHRPQRLPEPDQQRAVLPRHLPGRARRRRHHDHRGHEAGRGRRHRLGGAATTSSAPTSSSRRCSTSDVVELVAEAVGRRRPALEGVVRCARALDADGGHRGRHLRLLEHARLRGAAATCGAARIEALGRASSRTRAFAVERDALDARVRRVVRAVFNAGTGRRTSSSPAAEAAELVLEHLGFDAADRRRRRAASRRSVGVRRASRRCDLTDDIEDCLARAEGRRRAPRHHLRRRPDAVADRCARHLEQATACSTLFDHWSFSDEVGCLQAGAARSSSTPSPASAASTRRRGPRRRPAPHRHRRRPGHGHDRRALHAASTTTRPRRRASPKATT